MRNLFRLAVALAAGAALMYYLDPATGRRRRALVRDRGVAVRHDAERFVRTKTRRATDRLHGVVARTRARLDRGPIDDEQLHDRIRARLGHLIERPSAVEVAVHDGHVTLKGHASPEEAERLAATVDAMRGVEGVDNLLTAERLNPVSPPEQQLRH